ncbi:MAG: S46 family peptidase [Bacteroidales bacterium]|nr:S46 family peptidase [Bacteroidales bacterium]MCF8458430.1 S46 family peptidase [Bacteroidales bacterium]
MKKFTFIAIAFLISFVSQLKADEGMWIPLLLEKYNYADMQAKGMKLSAEDIFSINQTSLKDAIVIFGRGCTAELISNEGLILTNHHCGFGQIQRHSSLDHDYLTNGFWAMSRNEELVNKGLSVTFLVRMEDVTQAALDGVNDDMSQKERQEKTKENIDKIVEIATKGTHYEANVKPFFNGNEYYLFVNEVYKDVRLVGAPPSSIGKFGGDTDNWMWPRHTGDFSLFRIYADKDNQPAEYSPDNVPYKPKKFFPISLKGVKKDDFTMVYGYPGTTQEYLTSYAVKNITEVSNPNKIAIRETILDVMNADMEADPQVRIQYASKSAGVANAWKKWIGENRGLNRLDAITKKEELEKEFYDWVGLKSSRRKKYSNILNNYREIYQHKAPYQIAIDYFFEAGWSMELVKFARSFDALLKITKNSPNTEIEKVVAQVRAASEGFYKDYNLATDKKIFDRVFLGMYYKNVPVEYQPDIFRLVDKKFKGDTKKYLDYVYSKSMLPHPNKLNAFLDSYKASSNKKIINDPAYQVYVSLIAMYTQKLNKPYQVLNNQIDSLDRHWMNVLREMDSEKVFYPDANFSLRITYGKVDDYLPRDGVFYKHYTTLDGIIEKDNPEIYDYDVPDRLLELYQKKDYGQYAENGEMHVCFTGTNHTTGGNSGSPVINGNGELIGINFDRNWEGTMSDIMYDPDMCRNITLDVRYCLFIIDKFAGARHLIDEMELLN